MDLRPNKDGAWKLCKIGDLQDREKTLAVHVHETGLMENRGEVTRNRSSPSKLSQAKLQPTKGKRHRLSPASLQSTPIALFRRCRMDRRAIPSAHFSPSLSPRRNCPTLHLGIDARYVLNPSQNPAYENLTPLMWVQVRQPKRLIIQIGHNNGLYAIGADADPQRLNFSQDNLNGDNFFDSFETIANAVAALPDAVELILVVLLPKVGTVANLGPNNNARSNGYAEYYSPVFSTSKTVLPGATLAQVDQQIAEANEKIIEIFKQAAQAAGRIDHLKFLDVFNLFGTIDYKNTLDLSKRISIDKDHAIDNYYLAGSLVPQLPFPPGKPPLKKVLNHGGFQSVDGMHPTGCGYAVVASWAMKVLNLPNNDLAKLLEQSFIDDSLVHDVPLKLDLLVAVLTEFRRAFRAGSAPVQPQEVMSEGVTDPHLIDVVRLVHQIMQR